jgi:two-component system, LuxR family, response regulator FixJ
MYVALAEIACPEIVCLVDDDPSIRQSVACLLEADEVAVRTFAEPEAFLTYIKANPVKLAIVDIWMKPMTGMELLAHLCAYSPQTRVIFITGRKDDTAKMIVMQAGASGFFLKPFEDDEFLASVHQALGDAVLYSQHSTRLAAQGSEK